MTGDRENWENSPAKNMIKIPLKEEARKPLDYETLIKNIGFYQR